MPASKGSDCARKETRSSPVHTALARWQRVNFVLEQRGGALHAASHGGMLTCRCRNTLAG